MLAGSPGIGPAIVGCPGKTSCCETNQSRAAKKNHRIVPGKVRNSTYHLAQIFVTHSIRGISQLFCDLAERPFLCRATAHFFCSGPEGRSDIFNLIRCSPLRFIS
jgi:hypothetical protein